MLLVVTLAALCCLGCISCSRIQRYEYLGNFEKFRLLTWLEIKPNKQVRLYAPSHALVFRASFVFVRVRGCLLFARSCSRPSSWFRFGCFRLGCFPLFGFVFFVVSRFLVFVLSFGLFGACSCRALSLVRLVCLRWFWGVSVVFLRGLWFCAKSGRGCTLKL